MTPKASVVATFLMVLLATTSHSLFGATTPSSRPGTIIRPALPPATATHPSHYISPGYLLQQQILQKHRGQASPSSPAVARRTRIQSMRQQALANAGFNTQHLGNAQAASTDTAAPGGLPVNFPGFAQSSVLVPAAPVGNTAFTFSSLSADVNQDGLPDLINVQTNGAVQVLLNPGAKNLSAMKITSTNNSLVKLGAYAVYSATQDLDGDGYPELIVTDYSNNNIDIFHNQKDGTFANAVVHHIDFASGNNFQGGGGNAAFGDVTGDGKIDMVVYSINYGNNSAGDPASSFELITYPGKGDGTFGDPLPEQHTIIDAFVANVVSQFAIADMNKDGNLDLVMNIGGFDEDYKNRAYVAVLLGTGTGAFTNLPTDLPTTGAVVPNVGGGGPPGGFKVDDFDGDGNLDVMFMNSEDSNVYLATGNGDGTLNAVKAVITGVGTWSNIAYPYGARFDDITGDGIPDVLLYYDGSILIYPGQGKGVFSATPTIQVASGVGGDNFPAVADFNGDGVPDLARIDALTNYAAIYLGANGTLLGGKPLAPAGETPDAIHVVASGDFNGDGFPDILALDASKPQESPDLIAGINDGKGNFTYSIVVAGADLSTLGISSVEPIVGDLNGDNRADVLLTSYDRSVYVLLSTQTGFAKPAQLSLGTTVNACLPDYADIGDINHDGKADIVFAYPGDSSCGGSSTPSGFYTLLGKGDGTFTPSFTALGNSLMEPRLIDFNGDGNLDLALSDSNFDIGKYAFWIVPGKGDGTFNTGAASQPIPNTVVTAIIPGDFDADGKQDLTVGVETRVDNSNNIISGTSGVELLKGHGDFTFDQPQMYAFSNFPTEGAYADFNGDGKPDLVLSLVHFLFLPGPGVSNFGYLVNLGEGSFSPLQQTITSADFDDGYYQGPIQDLADYGDIFVGDFNGDGAIDVLNSQNTNDEVYASEIFFNAGAVSFSLTTSATASTQYSPVTLTATVTPSVSQDSPSGTVSFFDNGTLLQTANVSDGTATLTLTSLPVGPNVITASYSGDADFNGATASTSVSIGVTALTPAFTLSAPAPGTLTLTAGATGTVTVGLAGNAAFSGAVTLTCTGAPTESSCTVAPGSITLAGGQSTTAAVVIATTPPNNTFSAQNSAQKWLTGAGSLAVAGFAFLLYPSRRRRRIFTTWTILFLLATAAIGTLSLTGCGSSVKHTTPPVVTDKYPGTPAGTTTLTITATSGSITQTQTIALTVQ
jgi:hypothetical protein